MVDTEKAAPRRPRTQVNLTDFAREGEALYVQNQLSTIAVLVIRANGQDDISEFGPKDTADGTDVMELPATYLKNAQFRRQLQLGIFKIIEADDPQVLDAFDNQQKSWEAQQVAKNESDRFLEAQQPRSFSGEQCLGQDGPHQCAEYAIYSTNTRERPPLCQKHSHLASQFTPEETGQFKDGKPVIRWNRVTISGR
jgi:hypothetical protein